MTIAVHIADMAWIPPMDDGNRNDTDLDFSVNITVYIIRCLKIEATNDQDIYWPTTPNYDNRLWEADAAVFHNNGTIQVIWERKRVADKFRPVQRYYTLTFTLDRYPVCTTDQTPTTDVQLSGIGSWQNVSGWSPSVSVNTRTSIGVREFNIGLTFRVEGMQVDGQQSITGFKDYAIYDAPVCAAAEFTDPHLERACGWASGGTQVTKDDIPHKIQQNCYLKFQLPPETYDPWQLETKYGDCQTHAELIAEALKVVGIPADGTGVDETDCRVGEVRDCPQHGLEYHWLQEVSGYETNFEGVCKVNLTDEASPYYCYYDKAMGQVNGSYQYGTRTNMWTEWNSYPPPHHKVIHHYLATWENH